MAIVKGLLLFYIYGRAIPRFILGAVMRISQIIILSVLLFLVGCQARTITPTVSDSELWAEEEKQRQLVARDKIEKQQKKGKKKIKDLQRLLKVGGKISEAGIDLCGKLSRNPSICVYGFALSDKNILNAWADGKNITFTSSMMSFLKTDDQLAFIMSHEYAHNMMDHIPDKRLNIIAGAVIGSLFDGLTGTGDGTFSRLGSQAGALAYSPDFEAEADYVGLYIAYLAGYDITKAPDIWRRMALKNPDSIYLTTTHPSTASRFIAMEKIVKEIQEKKKAGKPLVPNLKKEEMAKKS
jgi:Zn-dependent protease with chaperone function